MRAFDPDLPARLEEVMARHVESGETGGVAWLARRGSEEVADQLGVAAGRHPGITPDGATGWGFGVGITIRRTGLTRSAGSYGWDGGLGSSWSNDPTEDLVGVVLSTDMFGGSDQLPRPLADFWTTVYAGLS